MKPGAAITSALQAQERRDLVSLALEMDRRGWLWMLPAYVRPLLEGLGSVDPNARFPSMHGLEVAMDTGDTGEHIAW